MNKKLFATLALSSIVLTACFNGIKKVEFKKFKDTLTEATKAEKPKVKSSVVNGTIKSVDKEYTSKDKAFDEAPAAFLVNYTAVSASLVGFGLMEDKDNTYYVGNGFKVKTEKGVFAWDKYLNLTKVDYKDDGVVYKYTVTYTYEK